MPVERKYCTADANKVLLVDDFIGIKKMIETIFRNAGLVFKKIIKEATQVSNRLRFKIETTKGRTTHQNKKIEIRVGVFFKYRSLTFQSIQSLLSLH